MVEATIVKMTYLEEAKDTVYLPKTKEEESNASVRPTLNMTATQITYIAQYEVDIEYTVNGEPFDEKIYVEKKWTIYRLEKRLYTMVISIV